ncbi:MAG: diaminopimelate decarboxylase [Candidatus Ratteibacteria bacterium]|nr:diaminopimelate decarboxylase [Candidatus Ratteibacteria bacterium]
MDYFNYRRDKLFAEGIEAELLAKRFGTPLYLYSRRTLIEHFNKLKRALKPVKPLICYSLKANGNLSLGRILVKEGAGLDIVSGGELFRALKMGCPPGRIVYAGVGKTAEEINFALDKKILLFNVESIGELKLLDKLAGKKGRKQKVALRLNPGVEAHSHRYLETARLESKFGLGLGEALEIFKIRNHFPALNIEGVHIHLGSQISDPSPYLKALGKLSSFLEKLKGFGVNLTWLDLGGGLAASYRAEEKPSSAEDFARTIIPLVKKTRLKLIIEPGRFIMGNAGILVTKVLFLKETGKKKFLIVDAGMNDLIRPALYGAYHQIIPLKKKNVKKKRFEVAGPICESGDFLGKNVLLPGPSGGDFLAVRGAGAYSFAMSSNYNARPRAAEVLVSGRKAILIRKRETYQDLIRGEIIK